MSKRARTGALLIGAALWLAAIAMTPTELAAANRRDKIAAHTVATMVLYLAAAILVLAGLPPRSQS